MKIAVLFLALIIQLNVAAKDSKQCFVSGTTVDKNNNPIKEANVIAYTPPTGWEDLVVNYKSDENGKFTIETTCKTDNSTLFVTPPLNYQSNFVPVIPPYWVSYEKYKNISGIKLPRIKKGIFNIGNVVVSSYHKIEVRLEDENGKSLLPEDLDSDFWLGIKTVDGNWVRLSNLSSNDIKNSRTSSKSSLLMTLPEGKWIIEVSLKGDKKPYYHPNKVIDLTVSNSDELQKIVLKMSK